MSARITSVVCTLGASPHLPATLRALATQRDVDHRVLVVDNDPESGRTRRVVATTSLPIEIVTERRRGLSSARNRAIASLETDLVAFTDDDAVPAPDWLARLVEVFDTDPGMEIGCVTGRVLSADTSGDPERWFELGFGFDKGATPFVWQIPRTSEELRTLLGIVLPDLAPGPRGPAFPISAGEFGSGNNMAFRRDWLADAGGFDEALGAGSPARGGEDLDIFRRVVLDGRAIVYEPRAEVRHHHRSTMRGLTAQAYGYGAGMAASVARFAMTDPSAALDVVRRLPGAMRLLVDPNSTKNEHKPTDYPRRLDWVERAGYAAGPFLAVAGTVRAHRRR